MLEISAAPPLTMDNICRLTLNILSSDIIIIDQSDFIPKSIPHRDLRSPMPYCLPDQDTRATPEYCTYKKVLYQYLVCGIHHCQILANFGYMSIFFIFFNFAKFEQDWNS